MEAYLIKEVVYGVYEKTPIRVLSIDRDKVFQVSYEYKGRGYKGMVFHEKLSNIEFKSNEKTI